MDKLCSNYEFICVADTKPAFSLSLLALPDPNETRPFFANVDLYCKKFDMTAATITKVFGMIAFALQFDNDTFHRSAVEDSCFYAEIYDDFEGVLLYIILQEDKANKMLLHLYFAIEYPSEREAIC